MPAPAARHPYGSHGDAPGAVASVQAPASFQGPESLMRRQDASSRIAGFAFLLAGPMLLYVGFMLHVLDPGLEVAAPLCAAGTLVLILGVAVLRRRTVFDARGIHSRGLLRTVHLPWPDSRAGFMVVLAGGGRGGPVALVEVGAAGHRVRLSAPRLSSRRAKDLRLRLEAEVDGIWAWALARGYARETMPVPPARQGADPRAAQAVPPTGSGTARPARRPDTARPRAPNPQGAAELVRARREHRHPGGPMRCCRSAGRTRPGAGTAILLRIIRRGRGATT
ncbi:hypothetical protein SAMN05216355_101561 [Actinomyces ruminicola]|uniref:PH domain-containing protein n=1 Tax=Actinomyces ruminicola TaxID=332524 RepID=A0A1H0A6G0_9ACTO|nr:hypothetical protein SAMN05216355_101561 [Actinomyces ruminicola]